MNVNEDGESERARGRMEGGERRVGDEVDNTREQ